MDAATTQKKKKVLYRHTSVYFRILEEAIRSGAKTDPFLSLLSHETVPLTFLSNCLENGFTVGNQRL